MVAPFSPVIVQVDRTPAPSTGIPINGKYLLPTLQGLDFLIDGSSYILPLDGGDVSSQSYAHLLATYSMFDWIYFNPLLIAENIDELDPTALFKDASWGDPMGPFYPPADPMYFPSRFQTGRGLTWGTNPGQMPTHTAVLDMNTTVTPNRPGVMITKEIDISAQTGPDGTDEFMVYWQVYSAYTTHDVATDTCGGINTPAIRYCISDTDQEPSDFTVYLSPDNGIHWCPVGLLEPVAFWNKTTKFRLAFVNRSRTKVYVASFAVLF